jgi:DNA topoisomerase-1
MIAKIQTKDFVRVENVPGKEKLLKELVYDYEKKKLEVIDTKMFLGKENKRMVPTNVGIISTKFLTMNFPQIMEIGFTAGMETLLDEISNGTKNWINVLRSYYDIITGQIQGFLKTPQIQHEIEGSNTDLVPDSQHKMVVYINNNLVGIYPETNQEIIFTKTKFGFAIKMFSPDVDKDIWANVKEKPTLDQAIELFKIKLHPELAPETVPTKSSVIKVIGQYQIKSGPYGPYIQTGSGPKNIKFHKITGGLNPEDITSEDCKRICGTNTKKTTKKVVNTENDTQTSTKKTTKKVKLETEKNTEVTSTKKTTKKVSKTNEI